MFVRTKYVATRLSLLLFVKIPLKFFGPANFDSVLWNIALHQTECPVKYFYLREVWSTTILWTDVHVCTATQLGNVLILPESSLGRLNRSIFKLQRAWEDWLGLKERFANSWTCKQDKISPAATNSNSPSYASETSFYPTTRCTSTDKQTDGQGDSSIPPLTSLRGEFILLKPSKAWYTHGIGSDLSDRRFWRSWKCESLRMTMISNPPWF